MPIPPFGYTADVPGLPKQSLPRSDWPVHAAISCLASARDPLGAQFAPLRQWISGNDIPPDRVELWLRALKEKHTLQITSPLTTYNLTPADYQLHAASSMSCAGGVLGLGVGLGKTLTSEVVLDAIHKDYAGKPLILASTKTALTGGAWDAYIPRFKKMGFSQVFVVSIHMLHKFEPAFPSNGGVLLIDEVHLLGGQNSRMAKHALALRLKVDYGLGLSGTVFHGGILRAMNTLNLAVPGLAGFSSGHSAASYFNCIREIHVPPKVYIKIVKPEGEDHTRFKEFVSSRFVCSLSKKSDIVRQSIAIPEQDQVSIELDGPWSSIHDDSVKEIRRYIDSGEGIPHAAAVAKKLARSGIESKVNWILDTASSGAPLVVFAQYLESLDRIEREFTEQGVTFVRVDGSVTGDPRAEAARRFQGGEVQVFLGQFEAAGISIDLTRARISIATDVSWRPDAYDQALGRTCRRGQEHRCTHYDLTANKFQAKILDSVRSGKAFDASITEYQDISRALSSGA